MRILAVSPYYSPDGGGLERYEHEILRRLAARGHEVQALAFTLGSAEASTVDGVQVERIQPAVRLGNTPLIPGFRRLVSDRIARFQPDVVVAHTPVPFPAEMAFLAAKREGVPFVATYHAGRLRGSSLPLEVLASLDRLTFERRMLQGASRMVAVSPYVRAQALPRAHARVAVIPPGVDPAMFTPGGAPEPDSILFVGPLDRSYRWKGVDVLWRAFARVRERRPGATLTLLGDGDRLLEFAQKASKTGGAVRLRRRVSDADLADAYRRAAVTVLPSTTDAESFGMVLAEANACGRPVVGSRIGGIPDFVHDTDNGLLAAPGDAWDLADKILAVLADPGGARRMGARGRQRVLREHTWDTLADRTETVLADAVMDGAQARPASASPAAGASSSLERRAPQ